MFRLMHFFMSLHHQLHKVAVKDAAGAGRKASEKLKFELGYILETMDLMSFNLVLREAETAISEKNTTRLAECVAALKEMMHIVVSGGWWRLPCFSVVVLMQAKLIYMLLLVVFVSRVSIVCEVASKGPPSCVLLILYSSIFSRFGNCSRRQAVFSKTFDVSIVRPCGSRQRPHL